MTRGQQIEHAIHKTVTKYGFMKWLELWDISKEEYDKFLDAGIAAIDKDGEQNDES